MIKIMDLLDEMKQDALEELAGYEKLFETTTKSQATNKTLTKRTGALRGSVDWRSQILKDSVLYELYTGVPYARIHETGGTIRPKRAKYLTIPIRDGAKEGKPARSIPGLFVLTTKRGKKFLVKKDNDGLAFYFLLVKSARIPARYWITKAVEDALKGI